MGNGTGTIAENDTNLATGLNLAADLISTVTTGDAAPAVYDGLATVDRQWLNRAAAELRARLRRTVNEVMFAGRVLARARKRLGRGRWEPWLAEYAQVPVRSASRLIRVHVAFKTIDGDTLKNFTPTALYVLAEPGTPQSIREYAVQQATRGAEVTAGAVAEWVALQRDSTPGSLKLASKDDAPEPEYDADKVHAADNWLALVQLLSDDTTIHISRTTDVENDDPLVSAVLVGDDGKRRTAAGTTLEGCVLQLAGTKREKKCRGKCKLVKPLDQFSRRKDQSDGRNRYCLECERTRVKAYERAKSKPDLASRASASGGS